MSVSFPEHFQRLQTPKVFILDTYYRIVQSCSASCPLALPSLLRAGFWALSFIIPNTAGKMREGFLLRWGSLYFVLVLVVVVIFVHLLVLILMQKINMSILLYFPAGRATPRSWFLSLTSKRASGLYNRQLATMLHQALGDCLGRCVKNTFAPYERNDYRVKNNKKFKRDWTLLIYLCTQEELGSSWPLLVSRPSTNCWNNNASSGWGKIDADVEKSIYCNSGT